jgi:hypothetical protein
MNLFLLSWDPKECAEFHCDKHVVKMILELVQMLYTSWHINNHGVPKSAPLCKSTNQNGYKKISNHNHPMSKWVRESEWNYFFTLKLSSALCLEFFHRYGHYHGCTKHVIWLGNNIPTFEYKNKTQIPQCMPEEYKSKCPVRAYKNYYVGDKKKFAKWTKRDKPDFFYNTIL